MTHDYITVSDGTLPPPGRKWEVVGTARTVVHSTRTGAMYRDRGCRAPRQQDVLVLRAERTPE